MSRKRLDMSGMVFGRLTATGIAPKDMWRNHNAHWICKCECGNEKIINGNDLRSGNVNSCGCLRKEKFGSRFKTHGYSSHPLYGIWVGIIHRCENPNMPNFKKYGALGIKVCDRWKSFEHFVSDIGPRPSANHSIDRVNPHGNYEPSNCRWATSREQALNKKRVTAIYRQELSIPC